MVASFSEDLGGSLLPPSPALPPLLQSAAYFVDPARFMEACKKRFGDAFTLRLAGLPPVVVLSRPDAIRDVLTGDPEAFHVGEANAALKPATWLTSFGRRSIFVLDDGRHQDERRWMTTAFHPDRLRAYERTMVECAKRAINRWPKGTAFDLHEKMQELTLDVLVGTIFGNDGDGIAARLRASVAEMLALGDHPMLLVFLGRRAERTVRSLAAQVGLRSPWSDLERCVVEVDTAVRAEIAARRAGKLGDDALSALIAASGEHGQSLGDDSLLDEVRTLLVAGHETTARALTFAVSDLLENPTVFAKLARDEGDDAYLEAAIRETLRLHPIVPLLARYLTSPARAGGRLYPASTLLACSVHLTQLDPGHWPEPQRFDPARFAGRKIELFEFLPFGQGKRRCLGMAFALLEMRTVIRQIASSVRLRLAVDAQNPRKRGGSSFAPPVGLRVFCER